MYIEYSIARTGMTTGKIDRNQAHRYSGNRYRYRPNSVTVQAVTFALNQPKLDYIYHSLINLELNKTSFVFGLNLIGNV